MVLLRHYKLRWIAFTLFFSAVWHRAYTVGAAMGDADPLFVALFDVWKAAFALMVLEFLVLRPTA
jgi:hypothetical protein